MVRTQIYLDQTLKKELNRISQDRRVTVSELIRQAIEQFLKKGSPKLGDALGKSFGLWSGRKDIGDAPTYVRKTRQEWAKREQRVKR
jgi:hypothetical protein